MILSLCFLRRLITPLNNIFVKEEISSGFARSRWLITLKDVSIKKYAQFMSMLLYYLGVLNLRIDQLFLNIWILKIKVYEKIYT